MEWSPLLPVLLGFFGGIIGPWGESGCDGTGLASYCPRQAVCMPSLQCGLSGFVLYIRTFDSDIPK